VLVLVVVLVLDQQGLGAPKRESDPSAKRRTASRATARVGRGSARAVARDIALAFGDVTPHGSDGRRRSADAELWRPSESDVARGERGGVGSLALPSAPTTKAGAFADSVFFARVSE